MKKLVLVFLLCIATSLAFGQQKPRIIILATGGTIAGEGKSSDRAGYTAGKIPVADLIGSIPSINAIADISGEQISSVGSQDMSIEIWKKLAVRINEIFSKNEADGVVITHGTDTQEETAYFLDLVLPHELPVVITGSMRPATAISADGPKNLFDAITVAADPKSKGRGVLVSFNESIYDSREVTKTSTTKVNAFRSPDSGPLGEVYDGRVEYYKSSVRETAKEGPFEVNKNTKLPKVEIVYMYADASPEYIDYLVKQKVKGIVIAGVGNGNFSKAFTEAIKKATKANIAVCRSSRCLEGRVVLDGETNDNELGTVVSDNLSPQKARILLMLGLTKSKNKKELQDYFFRF
ncbi:MULTISPECIES: asparaginase [unclassified Flavobacterium]|uniref:asparaginase n=1 Tax=unclassified Flavobacterium TaxID=196869 RepID=UPI00057DE1E1|nr:MULTISPECIES: asparaginase [unclassified Flavobacterium]KIA97050.1 L-asparaginase II [Flavobacterium sp. KMS]MEA9414016.1 asparaginase [Flavobacterium sp. PL02]OUL60175.1 L-asparaginase [Flavobacterium sp. AJR]